MMSLVNFEDRSLLETSDWVQLTSPRPKAAPPLTTDSLAVAASHNLDTIADKKPLTVEEFLKRSNRSKTKPGKTYRVKKLKFLKHAPKTTDPSKCGGDTTATADDDTIRNDALQLRSRNISRAQLSPADDLTSDVKTRSDSSASPSNANSNDESESSSSICDTPSRSPVPRAKGVRRKPYKPLKERIYEAAVSTLVDPEDEFAQDEPHPTRLPLRFVPSSTTENALRRRKKKAWKLVDPRKSKSIRTASFASSLHRAQTRRLSTDDLAVGLSKTLDRVPVGLWDKTLPNVPQMPIRKPSIKNIPTEPVIPECPPLILIPMKNADADYAALFRKNRCPSRF
ncbi:hypothetical protein BDN70DRAFT_680027 [Pholiota conissans]|uniref:Uncharacterized protein n=1 Tax=Pholiota conissans TaxID=109636 RepID=A0A9P5ZDY2_9AGAR|nr:hypothetical protein BDN70DRAFT_680027 [Pholiota conissans]